MDTGSQFITMPSPIASSVNRALGFTFVNSTTWTIDCDSLALLPPVSFTIGTKIFSIPHLNYVIKVMILLVFQPSVFLIRIIRNRGNNFIGISTFSIPHLNYVIKVIIL